MAEKGMKLVNRVADDRAKAGQWIEGTTRKDERGHPRRKFLTGQEEKAARNALARLMLTNELDEKLRQALAMCIDPTIFGGKDFIGPSQSKHRRSDHPARFEIVRRKTSDHVYKSHVICYLAERVNEQRGSLSRALDAAEREFSLSRRTLEDEYWAPISSVFRQLLPILKELEQETAEERCQACGAVIPNVRP